VRVHKKKNYKTQAQLQLKYFCTLENEVKMNCENSFVFALVFIAISLEHDFSIFLVREMHYLKNYFQVGI
jgi:hypothetical protein